MFKYFNFFYFKFFIYIILRVQINECVYLISFYGAVAEQNKIKSLVLEKRENSAGG